MNKKVISFLLTIFTIILFYFFLFKKNLFFLSLPTFLGLLLYAKWQKEDELFIKQKEILNTIEPLTGIIEDFLIIKHITYENYEKDYKKVYFSFLPIVRCIENDKLYITYHPYCYSLEDVSYTYNPLKPLKFTLMGPNGEPMNIGNKVFLYIVKELNIPLLKEKNQIYLNNNLYSYAGTIENSIHHQLKDECYTVKTDGFILTQNIITFEGLIDTDNPPKIEDYQKYVHNNKSLLILFLFFFFSILFYIISIFIFPIFT